MSDEIDDIDQAAARWHLGQADDAMNWDGFTAWLEADPRHRRAYDSIALLDARIAAAQPILRQIVPAEVAEPVRRATRWGWGVAAAAVAAAAVAAIGLGITQFPAKRQDQAEIAYRAPAGQGRTVRLADGSTAALAPGSVLRAGSSRGTPLALEGSAFFDVRHDPAHPLVVQAGGYEIRDVGTRFEVMSGGGMLRVAVAEGRVAIRSPHVAGEVALAAGKVLTAYGDDGTVEVRAARTTATGTWRGGRLVYDDVPLGLVVADIARYGGVPVEIDPGVARRRFSGVIAPGKPEAMVAALAQLTGLDVRTDGNATRLGDRAGR